MCLGVEVRSGGCGGGRMLELRGSTVKNGISASVGACVYAVALSGEISHVPFRKQQEERGRGVC